MKQLTSAVLFALTFSACKADTDRALSNSSAPTAHVVPTADTARLRAELQSAESLLPSHPDRGAVLFFIARRYARLGDSQKALAALRECASLHQGFDPTDAASFTSLHSHPEFRHLIDQIHQQNPPIHRARIAFTVDQPDLFPEGLAVDPSTRTFHMGSMHRKTILKITESGQASDFVPSNRYDLMPVGGVHVEATDHGLWAATDPGEKNRSELVHFDKTGKLLERYPIVTPGPHDLNDLVIRNAREIFTTDTDGHQVYRFDRQLHTFTALTLPRPLFYPNGITLSGDGHLLFIADFLGVLLVDLRDNSARDMVPGPGNTLAAFDGLYWYQNSLVGVQYGTGAYRIVRARLSPDSARVDSFEVLERGTRLVSDPTTGAILGSNFYYLANTGICNLKDDKIVDAAKLEPIHVAVLSLD